MTLKNVNTSPSTAKPSQAQPSPAKPRQSRLILKDIDEPPLCVFSASKL